MSNEDNNQEPRVPHECAKYLSTEGTFKQQVITYVFICRHKYSYIKSDFYMNQSKISYEGF